MIPFESHAGFQAAQNKLHANVDINGGGAAINWGKGRWSGNGHSKGPTMMFTFWKS